MLKFNRKKYVPQAAGNSKFMSGLVMDRKKHLANFDFDITVCFPTFPGPGQRPDSNIFTEANYDPPKDWPPVGYILRNPQVVWLSCETAENTVGAFSRHLAETRFGTYVINVFGDKSYFTGVYVPVGLLLLVLASEYEEHTSVILAGEADSSGSWHYVWIDGESNTYEHRSLGAGVNIVALGPQVQVNGGNTNPIKDGQSGRPYWIMTSIANPYQPIFDHYHNDVFPEVKARIEAMRKGKTWIDYIDWFDTYSTNNYWNKENQDFTAMYVPMCVATESMNDHFYGPDFLHIFIGHVSEILSGSVWDGDTDGDIYQLNRFLVESAWHNYSGYAVYVFTLNVTYDAFAVAPDFPVVVSQPPALPIFHDIGPNYLDSFGLATVWPADPLPHNIPYTADESWIQVGGVDGATILAQNIADQKKLVSDFNQGSTDEQTMLQHTADTEKGFMVDMCTDLADFGYTYLGDGSNMSADDIVTLIANHYGFDPRDGKDL